MQKETEHRSHAQIYKKVDAAARLWYYNIIISRHQTVPKAEARLKCIMQIICIAKKRKEENDLTTEQCVCVCMYVCSRCRFRILWWIEVNLQRRKTFETLSVLCTYTLLRISKEEKRHLCNKRDCTQQHYACERMISMAFH